jgi:uncharacterized protein (TIGR00369 family)
MPHARRKGWVEHLGLEETCVGPGEVRCTLTVKEAHQNIGGVIHGSVTFALLDTAMGHALAGTLAPGEFCSTTQISVQYLRAARPGDHLVAHGRVVKRGRRVAYLDGICTGPQGEEIARAQGTWYVGRAD